MWRGLSFGKKSRNGLEEQKDQWTFRGDFNARTGSLEEGEKETTGRSQNGKINIT